MELETIGLQHAPGYRIPLWFNRRERFEAGLGEGTRFRLVWVEQGTGILEVSGRLLPLIAPVLLSFHEQERPILTHEVALEASSIYFHPSAVNGSFSFENIRGQLDSTAAQDREWLWTFLNRDKWRAGQIPLGPASCLAVAQLFAKTESELAVQPDSYWPCRSRSYFLEMLMLTDRLAMESSSRPEPMMAERAGAGGKAAEVLQHLHLHYGKRITLEDLCRRFATNHTSLTQEFKAATGVSIVAYLVNLRVRVACTLLHDTTLPIDEIAERVGFGDSTYLGRRFRQATGLAPSEYRRRFNPELADAVPRP